MKRFITWDQMYCYCRNLAKQIIERKKEYNIIIGIARGGLFPAMVIPYLLPIKPVTMCISAASYDENNIQQKLHIHQNIAPEVLFGKSVLIVDDLVDSGLTLETIKNYYKIFADITLDTAVLFKKDCSKFEPDFFVESVRGNEWLVFPHEVSI